MVQFSCTILRGPDEPSPNVNMPGIAQGLNVV